MAAILAKASMIETASTRQSSSRRAIYRTKEPFLQQYLAPFCLEKNMLLWWNVIPSLHLLGRFTSLPALLWLTPISRRVSVAWFKIIYMYQGTHNCRVGLLVKSNRHFYTHEGGAQSWQRTQMLKHIYIRPPRRAPVPCPAGASLCTACSAGLYYGSAGTCMFVLLHRNGQLQRWLH